MEKKYISPAKVDSTKSSQGQITSAVIAHQLVHLVTNCLTDFCAIYCTLLHLQVLGPSNSNYLTDFCAICCTLLHLLVIRPTESICWTQNFRPRKPVL